MKRICNTIAAAMLFVFLLPTGVRAAEMLIPGGQVIGLQLENDTITVAAFDDILGANAKSAGLQIGDELLSINGSTIQTADEVRSTLAESEGAVTLTVRRSGKQRSIQITPTHTADGFRLGVYLKQGIAGIGTVTWYDPETGIFGTLGHGVSDSRGKLLEMRRGTAFHADVLSVKKGISGEPGQLRGSAEVLQTWGILLRNTPQGVFGRTSDPWQGEAMPVAEFQDVHTGDASIRCAVDGRAVQEYSVEILKIYPRDRTDNRNFLLKVTDPKLLNTTGGIVQGMSGSPIIQDGRIVGAVTHVCVNQ